jgi:hypothetical protein
MNSKKINNMNFKLINAVLLTLIFKKIELLQEIYKIMLIIFFIKF